MARAPGSGDAGAAATPLDRLLEHAECLPLARPGKRIFVVPPGYDPVVDAPVPADGLAVPVDHPAARVVSDPVAAGVAQILQRYQDRSFHEILEVFGGTQGNGPDVWRVATALVEAGVARFDPCSRTRAHLHLTFDGDPAQVIARYEVDYRTGRVLPKRSVWDQDPSYT